MKATFTFNLPEENSEMLAFMQANHAWSALCSISHAIRNHEKHDAPIETMIEQIKEHVADALAARGDCQ